MKFQREAVALEVAKLKGFSCGEGLTVIEDIEIIRGTKGGFLLVES